jgi:acyl-CoA reductase-like NAD-dependent aldehyde dehydrogenase
LFHYSGKPAFDKITGYIEKAKQARGEVLIGGTGDDSTGYFIQPTVILTQDPKSITMVDEIFGPVLTVSSNMTWVCASVLMPFACYFLLGFCL